MVQRFLERTIHAIWRWYRHQAASTPVCRGAGDKIAETWNAARADPIRSRFVASGLPFGRDTAERAVARLDAWASRWAAARTEECLATLGV